MYVVAGLAGVETMHIRVSLSGLAESSAYELLIRFVLGGFVAALAGVITTECGPLVGGLFLAFPTVFPAAVTLVERHETRRKQLRGRKGARLGRRAAGADAYGAAIGSVGLFVFGLIVWQYVSDYTPWIVLSLATLAWFIVSTILWSA